MQVTGNTLELKWEAQRDARERLTGSEEVVEVLGEITFRLEPGDVLDKARVEDEILDTDDIGEFFTKPPKSISGHNPTREMMIELLRRDPRNMLTLASMNWAAKFSMETEAGPLSTMSFKHSVVTVTILSFNLAFAPVREDEGPDDDL
jgi:hypothetical protein